MPHLRKPFITFLRLTAFLPILVILFGVSIWARLFRVLIGPAVDVGIGPEPLINNIYHRRALNKFGWSAETFVSHQYFITSKFDYSLAGSALPLRAVSYFLFVRALFRYKVLYIYFNGGPLAWTDHYKFESRLMKLAGLKTVVMPYGADVHDLSKTSNLSFKHAVMQSYPDFQRNRRMRIQWQVDYWSRRANYVISGCDWVEYMWHWDSLVPAHFAVDVDELVPTVSTKDVAIFRVFHAPNHRAIKGTPFLIHAVERLKAQGFPIELVLLENAPNEKVLEEIKRSDLVVDQLVIGWYGMFAVEAMALERPVICNIREDFRKLYKEESIGRGAALPVIHADTMSIESVLRDAFENRAGLAELGRLGRKYVESNHSLESIGSLFDRINRAILSN